jgi:DNA-binding NtrC family response regulator
VRFVTASAEPLEHSVGDGAFRPDLFARLSGFSYRLTALRDRREDLGILIASLLRRFGVAESDKPRIAPDVAVRILSYSWPLNVRELEQWLRLGWVLSDAGLIGTLPEAAPTLDSDEPSPPQSERVLSTDEVALRQELLDQLERAAGNVAEVARAMQKAPVQVYRWMKRYSLDPEAFRDRRFKS